MKERIFIILFIIVSSFSTLCYGNETIRVGALANRGHEECLNRWNPTAAYLSNKIPHYQFEIIPLSFEELKSTVQNQKIDFLICNPGVFVEMEALYGATSIATLKTKIFNGYYSVFGGVIFTKADRNINTLRDLKGKSFMAVNADSYGGWLCALRELTRVGIDVDKDLISFSYGGTHDKVVRAVLSGKIDAGTCRSGVIEDLASQNEFNINELRIIVPEGIINQQRKADFPFHVSTLLYPEWPFAKLIKTSPELATKVSIALLSMDVKEQAAIAADSGGWTYPLNYQAVHDLMRELKIGRYKSFGQITLLEVIRQYQVEIFIGVLIFVLILAAFIIVSFLYRRLEAVKKDLDVELLERKKAEAEILSLSITDQLTGLLNRRGFLSLAVQQLKLSERNKSELLLFFADLDLLKWINDTLGHEEGDKALIEAATVLKETFRTSDIIARLGGDEFAVLAIDIKGTKSEVYTDRLQQLIDIRNNQENLKYKLSISVGCAHYDPENPCSIDDLIARADKLMYEQKQKKKSLLKQSGSLSSSNP